MHDDTGDIYIIEMVQGVADQIRGNLKYGTGNIQHTGSNYEGNATKNASDFDMMVNVAPKGSKFQSEYVPDKPGYNKLKLQPDSVSDQSYKDKFVTSDGYLSGKQVVDKEVRLGNSRELQLLDMT